MLVDPGICGSGRSRGGRVRHDASGPGEMRSPGPCSCSAVLGRQHAGVICRVPHTWYEVSGQSTAVRSHPPSAVNSQIPFTDWSHE